jgi:hypothetical protein
MQCELALCYRNDSVYIVPCIILDAADLAPVTEETASVVVGTSTKEIVRVRLDELCCVTEDSQPDEPLVKLHLPAGSSSDFDF